MLALNASFAGRRRGRGTTIGAELDGGGGLRNRSEHDPLGLRRHGCRHRLGVDVTVGNRTAGMVAGFDRDFGTYAEQLVVTAADLAVVPDGLDVVAASTVPLNGRRRALE